MTRTTLALTATVLLGLPGGAHAQAPPPLTVAHDGLHVRGALGSFCSRSPSPSGDGSGATVCGDAAYPLRPHGRLPVRGRWRLTVDAGTRVTALRARLIARTSANRFRDVGGALRARRIGSSGRRWRVTLPRSLGDADVLDVSLRYPGRGDANFWAGLDPPGR